MRGSRLLTTLSLGLPALAGLGVSCDSPPTSILPAIDSVALVLSAVARTNTILKEGVLPLNENPAIRSLAALGARMVRVADSSRSVLGHTFVIDVGTGEYAPDDGRGGAPLDGTRFILYAVDSTARSVVLPLSEIGYVDVAGLSSAVDATPSVHAVIGQLTAFQYTAIGALTDPSSGYLPCCNYSVLTAPRWLAVTGAIGDGANRTAFTYSDTVSVSGLPNFPDDAYVGDRRVYHALPPTRGDAGIRSSVNSSIRFLDSDRAGAIRIAFPSERKASADSTVVEIYFGGVRGYRITSIVIDGVGNLLTIASCVSSSGAVFECYRILGDSVRSDTLEQFAGLVSTAVGSTSFAAYGGGAWTAPAEALLAPVLFAMRRGLIARGTGLVVRTATRGTALDPDGYSLEADGTGGVPIGVNDIATLSTLGVGQHRIELRGVASNCAVLGWNPRLIKLSYRQDTLSLDIECGAANLRSGRLAFTRGHDIYAVNADESDLVSLTNDPGEDDGPTWSPDGTRIAFRSFRNGYEEVWVANANGSGPVNVTNNVDRPDRESELVSSTTIDWSPDGSRIAYPRYHTADFHSTSEIAVVDVASGSTLLVAPGDAFHAGPQWSPDGTRIAFTTATVVGSVVTSFIYVVAPDGTALARLIPNDTASEYQPRWSPDGRRLAYLSRGDLYVVNADGSGPVNVSNSPGADDSRPVWSPSGAQIVFMSTDGTTSQPSILSANPITGAIVTLVATDASAYPNSNIVWSRDGTKLAFSGYDQGATSSLYVLDALGRWATKVTRGAYDGTPIWKP